jgi:single-strand DNA-binding protein
MLQGFLAGNLGRDAELRDARGTAVCAFSVAVTRKLRGEKTTTWVKCSVWGKRAPGLAQYLTKGTRIAVSGELVLREYNGKTYLDCNVSEVTLLGGGGGQRSSRRDDGDVREGDGSADAEAPDDEEIPF